MNVDPVGFIPPAQDILVAQSAEPAAASDFSSLVAREIGKVSDKIAHADNLLQQLATGQVDNLHQVMIAMEEAKSSFQLLVQVRNKLLEAYQDVLRMQV